MKIPFKAILLSACTTLSVFAAIVYTSSCNRDKCKTIVCAYGGVCNGGTCICPSGYEGTNCETEARLKFKGNWNVYEKGSRTQAAQYGVSIELGETPTEVVILNLYNYFTTPIRATVSHDSLIIPNQQYQGKVVFGVGYMSTDVTYGQYGRIYMSYEVVDTATNIPNDFGYYAPDGSEPSTWSK